MTKIAGIGLQGICLCFVLCNQKEHSTKKKKISLNSGQVNVDQWLEK